MKSGALEAGAAARAPFPPRHVFAAAERRFFDLFDRIKARRKGEVMEETLSLDDAMLFFSPRRNGVFSIFSIE